MIDDIRTHSNRGSRVQIVAALVIFISLVSYVFYLRPLAGELSTMKERLGAALEEKNVVMEQVESYEAAQKTLNLATEVERLEIIKSVPVGVNQDLVIKDLIKLVETNDLELSGISFGKSSSGKKGLGILRINASFQGNFNNFSDFLSDLEQNARMLQVRSISVQVGDNQLIGLKRVNFSLAIDAFYQEN